MWQKDVVEMNQTSKIEKLYHTCKKAIKINGYRDEYVSALIKYACHEFYEDGSGSLALEITDYAKRVLDEEILTKTHGTFFDLDRYCMERKTNFALRDFYYQILLHEGRNRVVDSYLIYLERKRPYAEKFYLPKRKCFMKINLIQSMQDLVDDKLDLLSVSLPPGTGKASLMTSKVLTPYGFTEMKNIKVGSKVISGSGNVANVIGVFPQGKRDCYTVTLEDGSSTIVSDNHLWQVKTDNKVQIINTMDLLSCYREKVVKIPIFDFENMQMGDYIKVKSVEYYGKEECQCIYIDDESHLYVTDDYIITHNTTIEKFFLTGIMAWYPDLGSLFFSHSGDITRMFFDGVKDIITNDAEYCWHEIFPSSFVYNTNAKLEQISINSYMAFPSLQTTSTGSNNAGKVRAQKLLLCDDLIGGIEQAMNKNELDKLWNIYSVDARQRKIPGAKEIHVATRWSVHDVIGRLQRLYDGNKRCRFIAVPDIDPETHKSNFNYDVNGFDEEFFLDQQKVMDEISYRCLYKNEPIEREGLLYHEEELRRYINLPIREPDAVWSISDTKQKGTDFLVMPVLYQYGEDYYLEDAICTDSSNYGVQYGRMADMIVNHNVQNCEIESNAGGDRVAYEIDKIVKEKGGYCNITTKYTTTNKETRIIVNAPWVKNHILFKDKETYSKQSEYGVFMDWLLGYSEKGKNAHDDVPDCLSLFAVWQQGKLQGASVDVIKNPFRM